MIKRDNRILTEINDQLTVNHEREVVMRVKFEEKLNTLNKN